MTLPIARNAAVWSGASCATLPGANALSLCRPRRATRCVHDRVYEAFTSTKERPKTQWFTLLATKRMGPLPFAYVSEHGVESRAKHDSLEARSWLRWHFRGCLSRKHAARQGLDNQFANLRATSMVQPGGAAGAIVSSSSCKLFWLRQKGSVCCSPCLTALILTLWSLAGPVDGNKHANTCRVWRKGKSSFPRRPRRGEPNV